MVWQGLSEKIGLKPVKIRHTSSIMTSYYSIPPETVSARAKSNFMGDN
jgi:hypothetical protein